MSLNRTLANLINTDGDVKAANLDLAASITVVEALDSLPTSNLTAGDQAYVKGTSRFYVSNGAGWYNAALVNATPSLSIDPSGAITLATDGSTTTITLTATDSDYPDAALTYTVESDGSFGGFATVSQDSSVFTITPLSEDSATTTSAVLTFKASDGVSFGSGDRTLTLEFKVQNSNYTTLLLKADSDGTDNQVDASTNARTVSEYGNVTSTAFTPHHPGGYSTYFDGTSNSQILIQGESTLAIGTGDFSFSCWYKSDGALDGRVLASSVATTSATQLYWNVSVRSDGAVWLQTRSTANSGLQKWGKSATGLVTANTWHHIAVSRQSGWHYVAVDGVQDTSVYRDQASFNLTAQELAVGASNITAYQTYNKGYIRDLNFCVGGVEYDLSVGDGNVAYTVPDKPISAHANTKVLLANRPYIKDTSASPLTIDTIGSAVKTVRVGPYDHEKYTEANYGGSVYFDGTGDYIQTPNGTYMNYGSDDFTFEAWIYPTASNGDRHIASDYASSGHMTSGSFHTLIDDGLLKSHVSVGGVNVIGGLDGTTTVQLNVWHHVALVRNGNTFTLYLDGESEASTTQSGAMNVSAQPFTIGRAGNYVGNYHQGYIADARLVKGTAVYTSAFTPPTEQLTAITNTELLTCTNKNDIFEQADGGQVMTKAGNVTASNTQRKFLTSSAIYFDGNGDYIDFVKKDDYSFESGVDFTVEGWWYMNSIAGRPHFIAMGTGIDGTPAHYSDWNLYYNSSNNLTWYAYSNGGNVLRQFAWTPVINTWYHIAVTRHGTNMRAFINGTQIGTTLTDSTAWTGYSGSRPLRIGRWQYGGGTNGYLNGYAQDIRITKGLARYTANFTPPTVEFSG